MTTLNTWGADSQPQLSDLTRATLARIESSALGAFSSVLSTPPALDPDRDTGALLARPLKGLPIAVKEVIDVAGSVCNYGCDAFAGRRPVHNAEIVSRLEALGAQVVGITRSTELAIARETITLNPWSAQHSPGGSSSGSAAAVGGGLVPFALGTQTIGSVIRPAAYCGAVGFKPTQHAESLDGILSLSPNLDHPGFFADSLERLTEVLQALHGHDWQPLPQQPRFIFIPSWFGQDGLTDFDQLQRRLREACHRSGHECRDLTLPADITGQEAAVTETIMCFDMFQTWGVTLLGHPDTSDELQRFLRKGEAISQADYQHSLASQQAMIDAVASTLDERDIIVFPSVIGAPPRLGQGTGSRDPQRLWTLLGMPALNLPVGRRSGFPVNLQLIAQRGADAHLLEAAAVVRSLLATDDRRTGQP